MPAPQFRPIAAPNLSGILASLGQGSAEATRSLQTLGRAFDKRNDARNQRESNEAILALAKAQDEASLNSILGGLNTNRLSPAAIEAANKARSRLLLNEQTRTTTNNLRSSEARQAAAEATRLAGETRTNERNAFLNTHADTLSEAGLLAQAGDQEGARALLSSIDFQGSNFSLQDIYGTTNHLGSVRDATDTNSRNNDANIRSNAKEADANRDRDFADRVIRRTDARNETERQRSIDAGALAESFAGNNADVAGALAAINETDFDSRTKAAIRARLTGEGSAELFARPTSSIPSDTATRADIALTGADAELDLLKNKIDNNPRAAFDNLVSRLDSGEGSTTARKIADEFNLDPSKGGSRQGGFQFPLPIPLLQHIKFGGTPNPIDNPKQINNKIGQVRRQIQSAGTNVSDAQVGALLVQNNFSVEAAVKAAENLLDPDARRSDAGQRALNNRTVNNLSSAQAELRSLLSLSGDTRQTGATRTETQNRINELLNFIENTSRTANPDDDGESQ